MSLFMQRIYGPWAARLVTALVIVTAFASVFSLTLGYSRVPYAAALDGNYFRVFAKVHPVYRFPHISLLALGVVAAAFCFLSAERCNCRSGRDSPYLAIPSPSHRVDRAANQTAGPSTAISHVALSSSRFDSDCGISVYPIQPPKLGEGSTVRGRYIACGPPIYMIRAWRGPEWPFGPVGAEGSS